MGIPLVEITTKPDINHPDECREAAERLGLLLWSSKVKKVLGSIRQDVNVSIKEGTRIEIKGVQKLDIIPILINHEILRQLKLVEIKKELLNRNLKVKDIPAKPVDLTTILSKTKSNFIASGIKSGKKLYGLNFKGFKGIFGKELIKDYRFGTEVSSKVKSISGLKGIIHSDEDLKKYKLSDEDIKKIKKELNSQDDDCFVLVLGIKKNVDKAINVITERVKHAFKGVPPETRRALEDGKTEFLRELHGGARLYPDTDSIVIFNKDEEIKEIAKKLPRYPWDVIKDYSNKFKLEEKMVKDLIFTGKLEVFDKLIESFPENPILIITTLLETTTALRRDGSNVENITDKDFNEIFTLLKNQEIGKEAIEDLMKAKANSPNLSIGEIKEALNISRVSEEDLNIVIDGIVDKNIKLINERKMGAMGPLMGEVMKEVRGKIDGKIVSDKLKKALQKKIKE
jgi:glutamyl-tRNA(Gln) amidotransferase subunit E